jgi:hypothetical protein
VNENTRTLHRTMDRQSVEAEARDGAYHGTPQSYDRTDGSHGNHEQPDIHRPRRWQKDVVSGPSEAKVLLYKLRVRTSAKGREYLSSWTGSAKLIGFKDAEPDEYGNEVWSVSAVTPQPREGLAGRARQRGYGREGGR